MPTFRHAFRSLRLPSALFVAACLLAACGGGDQTPTEPPSEPPSEPTLSTIDVTPDSATLDSIGATQQFEATANDQNGNTMSRVTFTWSSSDTTVATVDSTGLAEARQEGEVAITAQAEGIADTADLAVETTSSGPLERSFSGPSDSPHQPPDLSMAVSGNHVVVVTNSFVSLYSQSGTLLDEMRGNFFFDEIEDARPSDPRVVYDGNSERFFITGMDQGVGGSSSTDTPGRFFLAVSVGPDPSSLSAGDWHRYVFETRSNSDSLELFPDRPTIGVSSSAIVLVGKMEPVDTSERREFDRFTRLLIVDKAKVVEGEKPDPTALDAILDGERTSADIRPVKTSPDANLLFISQETPECLLHAWGLRDPLGSPSVSRVEITGSADVGAGFCGSGDQLPQAEQPDTDWKIDSGQAPNTQPVLRGQDLWTARTVGEQTGSGDRTGIHWVKIRVSGWPGSAEVVRSGFFRREGYAFYPAISANERGDFAVVYGRSSEREYPSAHFRTFDASSGDSISGPRLLKVGESSLTSGDTREGTPERIRYGDYFDAAMDPTDGSIWIIGEYVKASDTWASWIGNVAF